MSIYHKDRCSREEAMTFRKKVITFLDANKLTYHAVKSLRSYNGSARVYTGETVYRLPLRRRRELIEKTNEKTVYRLHSDPILEKKFTTVYRVDNWEEEQQALKDFLRG